MQAEEELVEVALLRYAHEQAAKWGADRFAAEFARRELEEQWLEASRRNTTPYGPAAAEPADEVVPSGPVDAFAQAVVVGPERDAWVLERPKHARHASVPRPPAEAPDQPEHKGWRRRRRDRTQASAGWTISSAEAAGMSAAGRRLYGLDDPS